MTDTPATPASAPVDTSTWDAIVQDAQNILSVLGPLAIAGGPGAALAVQIAQGLLSANAPAEALYKQFMSGTPPTADEIAAYQAQYEADDDKLAADIAKAQANLVPQAEG